MRSSRRELRAADRRMGSWQHGRGGPQHCANRDPHGRGDGEGRIACRAAVCRTAVGRDVAGRVECVPGLARCSKCTGMPLSSKFTPGLPLSRLQANAYMHHAEHLPRGPRRPPTARERARYHAICWRQPLDGCLRAGGPSFRHLPACLRDADWSFLSPPRPPHHSS